MEYTKYLTWALTKDRGDYELLGKRLGGSVSQLRMMHSAIGIAGEAGELADAVKKHILYNKPADITNLKEECGDLLWYMAIMLDQIGSSFEEVMQMNHDKLEKRFPSGFTEKHAQMRLDKKETGETE